MNYVVVNPVIIIIWIQSIKIEYLSVGINNVDNFYNNQWQYFDDRRHIE